MIRRSMSYFTWLCYPLPPAPRLIKIASREVFNEMSIPVTARDTAGSNSSLKKHPNNGADHNG
jgi:hypothetical protein